VKLSRDSLVVLGVVAAIALTYIFVVYRRQSRTLENVRTQMSQKKRQLEDDTKTAARLPLLSQELEDMKSRYGKDWDRKLPNGKELGGFLREISSNLAQEKLGEQTIQPGNPTKAPLYNCLPITMKFKGDFLALVNFLNRVDNMTRLTRVEQLLIEPGKEGDGLAIEMGMNIYFTEN
jgi:Tfp pilus assembly protein PilO